MTRNLKNGDRQLIKIIRDICAEQGITLETYSYDWILKLTYNGSVMYIYGYQFPLNDAAAELICGDKAALSAVLAGCGIPAAEHEFFMSPSNIHYTGGNGNWARLTGLLQRHGRLVCKRNNGSGGIGVYIVSGQPELELTVSEIFRGSRSMSVSPFYDIINEFRVIMLDGNVRLIYKKIRPYVTGDGKHTNFELAFDKFNSSMRDLEITADLSAVPAAGEKVNLGWKHNLGQGSKAAAVEDAELKSRLGSLAARASEALKIKFASVDIIETAAGFMILEINSGIMMENFAASGKENFNTSKTIYSDAINLYFNRLQYNI
jgi:glutathione synthase/RimK-type ligase-like ATP-grasp enzyme